MDRMARRLGPLGLLMLVLSLGSCGRDESVRLEFWTISLRPTFTAYIEERLDAFEREHPGVRVVWVDVPFMAIERKFIASAAAGRAPDVINLSDLMFARFAGAGAFADLEGLLPPEILGAYHEGALGLGRLAGGFYAVPWYLTTQATMSNRALLGRGGLRPEDLGPTWADLMARAGAFHRETGVFLFTQPLGQDSQLPMMLIADGRAPFRPGPEGVLEADLLRADVVEYLAAWVGLYKSGALPRECATRGFEHLIDVYQDERVAALVTGVNFLGRVRDVARPVYDRTAVTPAITGRLGLAHIAVMPVGVSARSRHPELAAALAAHMTSPESQALFCLEATILPSTPSALQDPYFDGPTAEEREQGRAIEGEARRLVSAWMDRAVPFTPALECWPEMRRVFEAGFKRALLENVELTAVLERVQADWTRIIAETNTRRAAAGVGPVLFESVPGSARGDGAGARARVAP